MKLEKLEEEISGYTAPSKSRAWHIYSGIFQTLSSSRIQPATNQREYSQVKQERKE